MNGIFIFFISFVLSLSKSSLYIENIYLSNIKYENQFINDFIINLDISEINIPLNIVKKNIFKIILESENYKEKFKTIKFKCNFYGKTKSSKSYIQCLLEKKISSNLKGPFYFREECFEKSFSLKYQEKLLYFSLEILEPIFCFGMIRSFSTTQNLFEVKFNYKSTNVIIPIAMALDNEYFYTTIVAITSIMENSYKKTYYNFYLMISPDFTFHNKKNLKNLEKKYNKCSIEFINMTNNFIFKEARLSAHITTPSYYRLVLSDLLPNIHKIIYLDGDILSFEDLKEMYIIDMNGLYYRGFLDVIKDPFNPKSTIYLCAGVLLINLEEIRKDDMVKKMHKFMIKNNKKLKYQDQTIINAVGYPKLGLLPAKFGIFNFNTLKFLFRETKHYRYKYKYSKRELIDAYYNPKILHFNRIKPWKKRNRYHLQLWWEYVKKTDFYQEIDKKFLLNNLN